MPNSPISPDANYAALAQRVTGLESAVQSIRSDIHGLVSKFDERSRPQWALIISGFTASLLAIGMVGGLIAWGLSTQNQNTMTAISEFKTTYDNNRLLGRQDQDARNIMVNAAIMDLRSTSVTKSEWSERNLARDHEVANLRESRIRADEDIQRQIDQLRQDHQSLAASLGNGGNSIQELKSEVSRLWDKLLEMNRKNSDAIYNRP